MNEVLSYIIESIVSVIAMAFAIYGLFMVGNLINGSAGRDIMRRTSRIQVGADAALHRIRRFGLWGSAHFELTVKFTDHSYYRTCIGRNKEVRHNKWEYSYNEQDIEDAIVRAVIAHDILALETVKTKG